MDALVEHFASAGDLRVAAPFLFHAQPATMAIAGADEHQRAEHAGIDNFASLEKRRMKTVIEPDLGDDAGLLRRRDDRLDLSGIVRCGLLHQHMLAGLHGSERRRGKHVIGRRDDDQIHILARYRGIANRRSPRIRDTVRQAALRGEIRIHRDHQWRIAQCPGSLIPDQTTTDDGGAKLHVADKSIEPQMGKDKT